MNDEFAPQDDELGIEFGDVEEAKPQAELRPDRNKHYAVAAVGQPSDQDLPIFVDLDAMLDMERHALSDTSVELGGVMLGGQFLDEQGRQYVLISDSLRAEHYESTKGSFKFTHDTWTKISRQREEFPDDLQMVGWYHTHPDWGVFLSGMDMFICDNFFNRPLDVALVIDPCRQDRGMFMWTLDPGQRVRRTDGFYLIASRFRKQELELVAAHLEGKFEMAIDPRYGHGSPPAVVNVGGGTPAWMGGAVLGVLVLQMCLVALLAWKVLKPVEIDDKPQKEALAALGEQINDLAEARDQQLQVEAQLRVIDQVVSNLQQGQPGAVQQLARQQQELERLNSTINGLRALERELESKVKTAEYEKKRLMADAKTKQSKLELDIKGLRADTKSLRGKNDELSDQLIALKKEHGIPLDEDEDKDKKDGDRKWQWYVYAGFVAVLLVAAAVALMLSARRVREEDFQEEEVPPPPDTPPPSQTA